MNKQTRLVALPTEHGGWAFLAAPLTLGLALTPTAAGFAFAGAALSGFLARHPLRLAVTDLIRKKRYPRTRLALLWFSAYGVIALAFLIVAGWLCVWRFGLALSAALALAGFQFACDLKGRGRWWLSEICGSVALALIAAAIALAGKLEPKEAWNASAFMALQAIPTILYVSARLRLSRGEAVQKWLAPTAHATAIGAAGALLFSPFAIVPYVILAMRCGWGVSRWRRNVPPMIVGIQEAGYSLVTVFFIYLALRQS